MREGRCNRCGSQLQWDESASGDVTPAVQAAVAKLAAGMAPLQGTGKRADSEDLQAVAAALRGQGAAPAARPVDLATEPRIGGGTPVDAPALENQWRQGIDTEANPLRTLKGVSTSSVSDLPVFIHPRAVRRPADPEFGPSEYELLDVIGEGGVGIVYSARQSSIDRNVAVKMIRTVHESDQTTRDKFLAEAIVTGDLDHPNIVPVYDLGKDPTGALFYSMKRVAGVPWSAAMSRKSQAENLDILMKVCDAIAFAHARGVVHRDIKPENVMLGEFGEVLVMDWGIALPLTSYRKSGGVLLSQGLGGTPAYMAPEMATGPLSKISTASDVYLLGAVLYEIVSGHPPHRGADVMSCVLAAAKNDIMPTDKGGELCDIALRAMAKKPEDRYASVQEFQKAVRSYRSHLESVVLGERAARQLDDARRSGSYDDFARAVFAYDEAVTLWAGNENARRGRSEARREFAECALYKGDFDLGLSQADPDEPEHVDVIVRLREAQRERQARDSRFRGMRAIAVFLGLVALVGGGLFTGKIYLLMLENEAKSNEARKNEKVAKDNEATAKKDRKIAVEARGQADRATGDAVAARVIADMERQKAEQDKDRAEEARFFAQVGIVNERIAGNAFDAAREILQSHVGTSRSRLRHWEWGRLDYLAQGGRADDDVVRTGRTGDPSGDSWTIEHLSLAADERTVVVAGNAGQVETWSVGDMRRTARWDAGHVILTTAINQDGSLVATAGDGVDQGTSRGVIRVWRRKGEAYEQAAELKSLEGRVHTVAFSPNGQRLVAGGRRGSPIGSAFLWDWEKSATVTRLPGPIDTVWSVAFSHDGQRVATAGEDKKVHVWNAATAQELQQFVGHEKSVVYCVAFSQDGRRIASGDYDGRTLVWPIDESTEFQRRVIEDVKSRVGRESPPAPRIERRLQGHTGSVLSVAFSRDDRRLITGAQDNTVKVWTLGDASSNATVSSATAEAGAAATADDEPPVTLRGHGGWVRSVRFVGADDESPVVVSGAMDHAWRRWNVARYREEVLLAGRTARQDRKSVSETSQGFNQAIYAARGRAIVTARADGEVQLWSASERSLVKLLDEGHRFLVSKTFVSPDGERLYTVGGDGDFGTLRAWNLKRGVEERVLEPIGRRGLAAPSADGRFVLTGGKNKTATWWDLTSGQVVHTLNPREGDEERPRGGNAIRPASLDAKKTYETTAVAVSRDGTQLFTGDEAGACRLWDARTGQLRSYWREHEYDLTGAAFLANLPGVSARGGLLLTSSTDRAMKLWDLSSNPPTIVTSYSHLDPIWSLAVSPDGRRVVTSSSVATSDKFANQKRANGKRIGTKAPGLWLWDLAATQPIGKFPIWERLAEQGGTRDVAVNSLTWSAESADVVYVATTDQQSSRQELWRWRPADATIEPALPAGTRGTFGTGLPLDGGRRLVTAGGKSARLWDMATGRKLESFGPQGIVHALDASTDGKWLVVAGGDGAEGVAKIWSLPEDLAAAAHWRNLTGTRPFTAAAFHPNGELLFTADGVGEIRRWSVQRAEDDDPQPFWKAGTAVHDLQVTPNGAQLIVVGDDAQVRLVDLTNASHDVRPLTGHSAPVFCASVSNDGRWLLTGSEDRTAIVWDLRNKRQVATLVGHSAALDSVAFSPDGLRALTGSRDSTAKIWNLVNVVRQPDSATGTVEVREVMTLPPHAREVKGTRFSPDGLDVMTASADGTLKIWPGNPLPPAVETGSGGIEYEAESPAHLLDEQAVISQPHPIPGERFKLRLYFEKSFPGDELLVQSTQGATGLEAREGRLLFRALDAIEGVEIGTYQPVAPSDQLQLEFVPDLAPSTVQAVLRAVAFRNKRPAPDLTVRKVFYELTSSAAVVDAKASEFRMIQMQTKLVAPIEASEDKPSPPAK